MIALGSVVIASLAVAMVIGTLMLLGGVAEIVGAFWCRGWSGFFLHLLSGVLSIVIGVMFLRAPLDALAALTLLAACFLIVGGVFKIVAALSYKFAAWGWPLFSGIIDLVLGVMIWQEWPASALWVIGMFVGINMVFRGFNWIGLGLQPCCTGRPRDAHTMPWTVSPAASRVLNPLFNGKLCVGKAKMGVARQATRSRRRHDQPVDLGVEFACLPFGILQRDSLLHTGAIMTGGRQPCVLEQSLFLLDDFEDFDPMRASGQDLLAVGGLGEYKCGRVPVQEDLAGDDPVPRGIDVDPIVGEPETGIAPPFLVQESFHGAVDIDDIPSVRSLGQQPVGVPF